LGGVGTFGVVACVQEVAVAPGELLADADLMPMSVLTFDTFQQGSRVLRSRVQVGVSPHIRYSPATKGGQSRKAEIRKAES
jgi:hypothetical protein